MAQPPADAAACRSSSMWWLFRPSPAGAACHPTAQRTDVQQPRSGNMCTRCGPGLAAGCCSCSWGKGSTVHSGSRSCPAGGGSSPGLACRGPGGHTPAASPCLAAQRSLHICGAAHNSRQPGRRPSLLNASSRRPPASLLPHQPRPPTPPPAHRPSFQPPTPNPPQSCPRLWCGSARRSGGRTAPTSTLRTTPA